MSEKILVIDDEAEICELLDNFLTREGYNVTTTTFPEKALELVKEVSPRIILLDIKMPVVNGVEVMKRIREFDNKVGIIMITAVVDKKTAEEVVNLGAADYIVKPFDLQYLKNTLKVKIATIVE